MILCGPKYLRGIVEPCDGSCCGRREDGTIDLELINLPTELTNSPAELTNSHAERRVIDGVIITGPLS